jgi:hypothetical protein
MGSNIDCDFSKFKIATGIDFKIFKLECRYRFLIFKITSGIDSLFLIIHGKRFRLGFFKIQNRYRFTNFLNMNVATIPTYQGTSRQCCGASPFLAGSGSRS